MVKLRTLISEYIATNDVDSILTVIQDARVDTTNRYIELRNELVRCVQASAGLVAGNGKPLAVNVLGVVDKMDELVRETSNERQATAPNSL